MAAATAKVLREDSPAVQAHLGIMQSVIERMAGNSASCKAWCVALVSAVLVLVGDKGKPDYVWIAVIPAVLFMALDTHYLALEKAFRASYNRFIARMHSDELIVDDLYAVAPSGKMPRHVMDALRSFSIWPFYLTLLAMVYVAFRVVATSV
ncbi:MAG: hypothetical protein ACYC77_07140 [Coriobacteriia bacterium]